MQDVQATGERDVEGKEMKRKDRGGETVLQHRELPTAKLNSMKQNPTMGKENKNVVLRQKVREWVPIFDKKLKRAEAKGKRRTKRLK